MVQHSEVCAARNKGTSLVFVLASAIMVLVIWRDKPALLLPDRSIVLWLGYVYSMVLLAGGMIYFSCFRERLALGLAMVSFGKGLVTTLRPDFVAPFLPVVREILLGIWLIILITSLSLLKSALRSDEDVA